MQNVQLTVQYIPVKTCFVYMPYQLLKKLSQKNRIIKVTEVNNENKIYYLSYSQSQSSKDDTSIGLSSTFAQLLDLKEGIKLNISFVDNSPVLTCIEVVARHKEDLEIVKLRYDKLQEIILQQINIVSLNQPIVIWLSKNLNVVLYVKKLFPNLKYGRLEEFTEVHVQEVTKNDDKLNKVENNLTSVDNVDICEEFLLTEYCKRSKQNVRTIVRVCELPNIIETKLKNHDYLFNNEIYCDFNIFIHLSKAAMLFSDVNNCIFFFCKLKKIPNNHKQENDVSLLNNEFKNLFDSHKELIVKVIIIENNEEFDDYCLKQLEIIDDDNVFVSSNIMKQLKLKLGTKISLEKVIVQEQSVTGINLIPINNEMNKEIFYYYIKQLNIHKKILINSNTRIFFKNKIDFGIQLMPETINYGLFTNSDFEKISISVKYKIFDYSSTITDEKNFENSDFVLTETIETILNECKTIFSMGLESFVSQNSNVNRENILICGGMGTGKTTLCETMKQEMGTSPYFFHIEIVNCKKLKGKKAEVINKFLITTINNCTYYQPSLLFLDNLDCITNNDSVDGEENTPDAINASRIADTMINIITSYQTIHCLNVVATCINVDRLGNQFKTTRGIKLFNSVLKINNLTKKDRFKIMQTKLNNKQLIYDDKLDWDLIENKTEGFVTQDLVDLIEKVVFVAWKQSIQGLTNDNNKVRLNNDDFIKILNNFNPISLHGVSLFTGSGHNWDEIGGLNNVKNCLIQILQWPLTYPELFKNAPVKQQSGVLLYGMPGTGKTMIAGAIAKECSLNFINIKGPELLSKYIGASEEAIRDIFDKAQKAKPCVLFFDEFESLAPRRGHDSTGVTDRVVNQLLTQFDGIEGREGVAIVAASSRPDLLDPALLRPGRLDKSLLCPLPQEEDRKDILNALCRTYQLDVKGIDSDILARKSEGFTGADLNSVFNQAKLNIIDEHCLTTKKFDVKSDIVITQNHLLEALKSTQPSLTASEVMKFNRIYAKFGQGDNFTGEMIKNPKSTLA